ncbi:MAG: EF-hand domain-containing protein [Pseudomonadota bacterium]
MKRIMIPATAALVLSALATAVVADDRGARFDFEAIDTNGDGQVTPAEMEAMRAARFAEVDTNGDGELSQAELLARAEQRDADRMTQRIERFIDRADEDDNGTLSLAETSPGNADRIFSRLDSNDDGVISAEEFEERAGQGRGRHGGGPRRG